MIHVVTDAWYVVLTWKCTACGTRGGGIRRLNGTPKLCACGGEMVLTRPEPSIS